MMEMQNHPLLKTLAAAEKALFRGGTRKAVELYTQAIDSPLSSQLDNETLSACFLNRGAALRKLNRQPEALRDYERAAELNPNSFKSHLNAGLIYAQDLGRYVKALDEFGKALEISPTCIDALSSRGLTRMLMGDCEGAERDLRAALSLDPRHVDTLCNLGNVFLEQGRLHQAAETYQQALEIDPRDSQVRYNLAAALERLGASRAAGSVLRKDRSARRLWRDKGGPVALTPLEFDLLFVRTVAPLYALLMSGSALFMTGSYEGMLVGVIVGAALGVVLAVMLARFAKSRPRAKWMAHSVPDWARSPFPSTNTKAENETGALGAVLGAAFGLVGALVISLVIPLQDSTALCLGPIFGLAAGGGTVHRAFRKLAT